MALMMGHKLVHDANKDVYVVGNATDIRFVKERGRVAWELSGGGKYVVSRVGRCTRKIYVDDCLVCDGQVFRKDNGSHEYVLDEPLVVRSGSVIEIIGDERCMICGITHGRVFYSICEECGRKEGLEQCDLCNRWSSSGLSGGLCDVCCEMCDTDVVGSSDRCQYGIGYDEWLSDCSVDAGGLCYNCPFLYHALDGDRLYRVDMTDGVLSVSSGGGVIVNICTLGPGGDVEGGVLSRIRYLCERGLLSISRGDLKRIKGWVAKHG